MFTRASVGSVLVVTAFGLLEGQADAPRDQEEFRTVFASGLEGAWLITLSSAHSDVRVETVVNDRLVIRQDDLLTFFSKSGKTGSGKIKVAPSKMPAEIDYTSDGLTAKGIYKIEDNTLSICFASPGLDRPNKFESSKDPEWILMVLKRAKD
jgi:uncharacterized protein (TIGR03067 family)